MRFFHEASFFWLGCVFFLRVQAQEPEFPRAFPYTGTVNALIVLVQTQEDTFEHCAELTGYDESGVPVFNPVTYARCAERPGRRDQWMAGGLQSWTDDPRTEWPVHLPRVDRHRRLLPYWAQGSRLIDPPRSEQVTQGSLTDVYQTFSKGAFALRGYVYPYVYVHDAPESAYHNNPAPFPNSVVKMAHEVISFVQTHPADLPLNDATLWDTYTNGQGENRKPDGVFDMIILVYRFNSFRQIIQGSGISSFGTSDGSDGFEAAPLQIGTLNVQEGYPNGSGVIAHGTSLKEAERVIVHEIGHRYYGGHTNSAFDVMGYGSYHFYGAGNRLALGWAKEEVLDLQQIMHQPNAQKAVTLGDLSSGKVLRVIQGKRACGDLMIEARTWTNVWDMPPDGRWDDGDGGDTYLSQEGLYLHKAGGTNCGGDPSSSLEQTGLQVHHKRLFVAGGKTPLQRIGFTTGDILTPLTPFPFPFHQNAEVDGQIALTNIRKAGRSFRFVVHGGYLDQPKSATKSLGRAYTFNSDALARSESLRWRLRGSFWLPNGLSVVAPAVLDWDETTRIAIPAHQPVQLDCTDGTTHRIEITPATARWSALRPFLQTCYRP